MPRVTITNNTDTEGSPFPKGVGLNIAVGNGDPKPLLAGETQRYDVARNQVVTITPTNNMMKRNNYQQLDGRDRTLSIVPVADGTDYGVRIEYVN